MKSIAIRIRKKDVLHQVNLRNFYAGESAKQGNNVELATKMQTSEDNFDVLEKYVTSACTKLVDVLNPVCIDVSFTVTGTGDAESLDFNLSITSLFADSQESVIKEGSFEYLVNWAIYEWLSLAYPAGAKQFFDKCALIEEGVKSRINKRLKPEAR